MKSKFGTLLSVHFSVTSALAAQAPLERFEKKVLTKALETICTFAARDLAQGLK